MLTVTQSFLRTLYTLFKTAGRPEAESHLKLRFDEAKRFSDFVGMLTRFSFVFVFTNYFAVKAPTVSFFSFRELEYSVCAGIGFTSSLYFAICINNVIAAFLWRDVTVSSVLSLRIFFLVSGIVTFWTLVFGIGDLSRALANATKLGAVALITFSSQ